MASRFYLPSSGSAAVSPAFDAAWEDTSIGARLPTDTTKASTAMTTASFTDSNGVDRDILFRQYVSGQIAAQTIAAQTVGFVIRASETDASNNLFTALGIRVVSADGSTVTGTVLAVTRDATEIVPSTLTNRNLTATTTSVVANDGDRLVFEIGTAGDPGGASPAHSSSLRIGDTAASDLTAADTGTTDNNPWIEFPNTITAYTPSASRVQRLMTQGVG